MNVINFVLIKKADEVDVYNNVSSKGLCLTLPFNGSNTVYSLETCLPVLNQSVPHPSVLAFDRCDVTELREHHNVRL